MEEFQGNDKKSSSDSSGWDAFMNQDSELSADLLTEKIEITKEDSKKTSYAILSFIRSYKNKESLLSDVDWLTKEFRLYPEIWESDEQLARCAKDIVSNIEQYEAAQEDLESHYNKGLSRDNWLAQKIEQSAKANGVINVGEYAQKIDTVITQANNNNINVLYRNDGQLSQQYNLDGFIAEHHHANTFNIDAAAKGSEYRAEVLEPALGNAYTKNSVDIVVRDSTGKIVKRYQAKYGSDAEATNKQLKQGDYRGQRKLVPEGQGNDIKNSTEAIEVDGVSSKPLSKEDAKKLQRDAQEKEIAKQYDWNATNRIDIAKSIGKKAAAAAIISIGFQGARVLGRRIWNSLTGEQNNSVEEDLEDFVKSSIQSSIGSALVVAVTGGITVATKSGWLGQALKNTPAGHIANAVCLGIENAKVLYKFAKGEITGEEALDQSCNTTCSMVGALVGGAKGASAGATLGSVLGPVGTIIGGITGGIVGGVAGSTVGEAIYNGGKKIVSVVTDSIKSVVSSISSGFSSACNFVGSLFSW